MPCCWLMSRDDLEDLLDDERRQAERRLVEQQEARPAHQRARDREHLLLAARQRAAALALALLEDREQREDALEILGEIWRIGGGAELQIFSTVMRGKMRLPSGDWAMPRRTIS